MNFLVLLDIYIALLDYQSEKKNSNLPNELTQTIRILSFVQNVLNLRRLARTSLSTSIKFRGAAHEKRRRTSYGIQSSLGFNVVVPVALRIEQLRR